MVGRTLAHCRITMELAHGQALDRLIPKDGLSVDLILDIAIAEARAFGVFKYLSLFWQAICALGHVLVGSRPADAFNILVPIGISFYVFKLLSYAIDVYQR